MKFSTVLSLVSVAASTTLAAPVDTESLYDNSTTVDVPEEAILAFVGFDGTDVALTPFRNETHSGVLFINTTIYESALASEDGTPLVKREADAEPHWLRLGRGEPLYKREAEADAEADAHWLRLGRGEPLYKREAEADAEADAHWLRLGRGEPLYKREAEADAEADAHWLRLGRGEPLYKREAEADAEADAHWLRLGRGEPLY
ncbi:hypothetical protein TBLA_0B05180 [Henningerozyma blattae CBS 6284]|uniref:Mating factor alpha n=1 Tax=Henningerozyma blattae (strain ATCC 34711 / CBS 6284 / DSM 70876 / NBRC 10599 / NRRL Y-10934 / UCD 77-7) TaxID=1071380 RepID=I2GYZ9_HENB6|nr:hypothetical protein TBLA_0B05180 [Tetrapisispora blattae CBS 6284]CCH59351.1 hypothetical protein TBLA_0B05180 [Tetrapisispora blattae CBS 6284]